MIADCPVIDRWVASCAQRLQMRWSFLNSASAVSLATDLAARPGWRAGAPVRAADMFTDSCDRGEGRPRYRGRSPSRTSAGPAADIA